MGGSYTRWLAVAICLLGVSRSYCVTADDTTMDAKAMEGLWSGGWGSLVGDDGVVYQPVMAELLVKGDRVEMAGFPNADRLEGTFRLDARAKQLRVFPTAETADRHAKEIVYAYEITNDNLTLVDENERSIELSRRGVTHIALANAQVEFAVATGINDSGDLLTVESTALQAGQAAGTFFESSERKLKTQQATVLLMQETGSKAITIEEARRLIRRPTAVVVAYRQDAGRPGEGPSRERQYRLWERAGSVSPDDKAVHATFSRILRPGTLVFILSTRENEPVP